MVHHQVVVYRKMEPVCPVCRVSYPPARQEAYLVLKELLRTDVAIIIMEYEIPMETYYEFGGINFKSRAHLIAFCEEWLQGPSQEIRPHMQLFRILKDMFQRFHGYNFKDPIHIIGIKDPPLPSDYKVFYYVPKPKPPPKSFFEIFKSYPRHKKILPIETVILVNYRECLDAKHFPSY